MKKIYISLLSVLLVMAISYSSTKAQDLQTDSLALVALYNDCDGANWGDGFATWLNGPLADWEDVTVSWVKNEAGTDSTQRVTHVEFSNMDLNGTFPAELGNLTEMSGKIQLFDTEGLTGTLPAFIWNWTKVTRLQIKPEGSHGTEPGFTDIDVTGIENMTELTEINIHSTNLKVPIPKEFFELPKIQKLYIHEGAYTGTVPTEASAATQLTRFYVMYNQLEGPLPFIDFADKASTQVKLEGNYFSFADVKPYEDIRSELKSLVNAFQYAKPDTTVVVAEGSSYTLSGTVADAESYAWFKDGGEQPVSLEENFTINSVMLADEGTYMCKAQSSEIANFDIRTVITLKTDAPEIKRDSLALVALYNECGGADWVNDEDSENTHTYPTWLNGPLADWEDVTVSWVKNEAGTDSTQRVTHVQFKNMDLVGTLPDELGNLTEMSGKIEIHNSTQLIGTLPAVLWNWTKVDRVQVKFCGFTSMDLTGIENMVNLTEFNTEGTPFTGEMPAALFNLPAMQKLYVHASEFTGAVPADAVNATKLTRFYVMHNQLEGPLPFIPLETPGDAKIKLTGNYFSFADVKPWEDNRANYNGLENEYQWAQDTTILDVAVGGTATFELTVEGGESYAWFKNGVEAPVSTESTFVIDQITAEDNGTYMCKVQNSEIPNFDIRAIFILNNTTSAEDLSELGVKVYPNPVQDKLYISRADLLQQVVITNIVGQQVKNVKNTTGLDAIDVSELKKGIYLLTMVSNDKGIKTIKFLKK